MRSLTTLLLCLGLACSTPTPPTVIVVEVARPTADLDAQVSWHGCASVVDHGRCEVDGGALTFWVPGPASGWRWTLDGQAITPTSFTPALGGTRVTLELEVPTEGEHRLVLDDPRGTRRWDARLEPYSMSAERLPEGPQIERLLGSTETRDRLRLARALADAPSSDPLDALARARFARRLSYDRTDPAASASRSWTLLDRMLALAQEQRRWGEVCEAASVGLFFAVHVWDVEQAAKWERWVEPCTQRAPRWVMSLGRELGLLRLRQGRYAEAEARFEQVRQVAAKLGRSTAERWALENLVEVWARTERWERMREGLETLESHPLDTCDRAALDSYLGFQRLLAAQHDVDLGDPRPALLRALALHLPGAPCDNEARRNHDRIKLGYAAAHFGDHAGLQRTIEAISEGELHGKFPAQFHELRTLEALGRGDLDDADEALAAMARTEIESDDPSAPWRRAMLRARVAARAGAIERELRAYRDAEALMDRARNDATSKPLRERWLAGYRSSAVLLVERLLEQGRVDEAACAARHARRRGLAIHDALALKVSVPRPVPLDDDDTAPVCSRPWSRHPGELCLLIVPGTDGTWLVFAAFDQRIASVTRLDSLPEGEPGSWWDRWSDSLDEASRVRVLPSGAALAVPFHRLGWRDQPLFLERAVSYGLDLAPRAVTKPASAALVSFADADPLRALHPYRSRVAGVHAALDSRGWSSSLHEGVGTSRDRILEHLPRATLLHYFGHGERLDLEGHVRVRPDDDLGTTAALLPGHASLTTQDVLELDAVPRWVVLLGCQLGAPDLHGWSGGLSLAHAFLLRGSEQVLAPVEPLEAEAAAQLGLRLYEGPTPESFDLALAFQRASASYARDHGTEPRWKDLRVWSR